MIKRVAHAHFGPIWYHSDVPYSQNQFLGLDFFWPFLTANRLQVAAAAASAIAQLILIDKFRSIVQCIFLATLLRYCIPFFVNMHAGKNLQSTFFLEFLSFFGENNRKLLYGSLTLLKVNLLTENPFLTCSMPCSQKCQSLYEIVFEYSSLDFFLKLSVMKLKLLIRTLGQFHAKGPVIYYITKYYIGSVPCVVHCKYLQA